MDQQQKLTAGLTRMLADEERTIAAYRGQVTADPPMVHAAIRAGLLKEILAMIPIERALTPGSQN